MTDTVKEILGMIIFAFLLFTVPMGGCAWIVILTESYKKRKARRRDRDA